MEYQIYKVKEKSDEFEKFHYNIKDRKPISSNILASSKRSLCALSIETVI